MSTEPVLAKVPVKRLAVLISGSGSNLQALIDACANGQINGEIVAVISNRPDVYGLERAARAEIPAYVVDHTEYADRCGFEQALQSRLDELEVELVVLAGFMRILTPGFVEHYLGRMLNIHPSLLPDYKGINTHQRVLDDGGKLHGVTVHFVTAELDGGPLILQAQVPVLEDDNAEALAKRVLVQEHRVYPQVVEWFCGERLQLQGGSVILDGEKINRPVIFENS